MSKTIAVGVLRERNANWQFVDCLMRLLKNIQDSGYQYVHIGLRATNIYKGREAVADHTLSSGADYLLFVDSDEVFVPETAVHLAQLDLPVVSGVVYQRNPPYTPCLYRRIPNSHKSVPLAPELQQWMLDNAQDKRDTPITIMDIPAEKSIIEIDECGTGCMMIRRDVLESIAKPRFRGMGDVGTDIMFCRRVRAAGFPIYADLRVQLGHLTNYPVTMGDFMSIDKWVLEKDEQEDEWRE